MGGDLAAVLLRNSCQEASEKDPNAMQWGLSFRSLVDQPAWRRWTSQVAHGEYMTTFDAIKSSGVNRLANEAAASTDCGAAARMKQGFEAARFFKMKTVPSGCIPVPRNEPIEYGRLDGHCLAPEPPRRHAGHVDESAVTHAIGVFAGMRGIPTGWFSHLHTGVPSHCPAVP